MEERLGGKQPVVGGAFMRIMEAYSHSVIRVEMMGRSVRLLQSSY